MIYTATDPKSFLSPLNQTVLQNRTCFWPPLPVIPFRQWLVSFVMLEIFVYPSNKCIIYGPELNFSNGHIGNLSNQRKITKYFFVYLFDKRRNQLRPP